MTCVKTGAHVFYEEYHEFGYGDMHQFNGAFVFRESGRSNKPINGSDKINYQVFNILEDWKGNPGTVVCGGVMDHGYEGKPIKQVLPHVKISSGGDDGQVGTE